MLLFDPDAGKTIEEIIQDVWEHKFTAQRRAEILAIAEAAACTWFDVVCECIQEYMDALNDPITGPRLRARQEFQAAPFGKDPLL